MYKYFVSLFAVSVLLLSACKKDVKNPEEDGAHGVITTLSLKFSQGGVFKTEAVFDDPDGPGGNDPIRFDDIKLEKGQTYNMEMTLTNKTKTPNEDMTEVIRNAGHQHLFFLTPTNVPGLNISLTDKDRAGLPIGLSSTWQTPNSNQTGTVRVSLRHIAFGKSASSLPTAGHSDIQVDFKIILE
jgi:hypothetical protein